MKLFRHRHRFIPVGTVTFTEYHDHNIRTNDPYLIHACKCGDWRWEWLWRDQSKGTERFLKR